VFDELQVVVLLVELVVLDLRWVLRRRKMTGLEIGAEVEAVKMKGLEEGKELAQHLQRGYWVVVLLEGPALEVEIEIAEEVLESNSTSQFEAVKQLEEPVSKQKSSSKK